VCDLSNCFRYVYDEGAISGGVRFATILVTAARALAFRVIRLRTRTLRPGSLTDVTQQGLLISSAVRYTPVSAEATKEVTDQ
jgi:hypothetical protein